jgi:uncharacterized membrane protein YeaQ/YmgE (transglycosylase-associated protein family)
MLLLTLAAWLAIGLLIGYVATLMVDLRGDDPRAGLAVAGMAGLIGGLAYIVLSGTPLVPGNYWAHGCAALAAILAAIVWHVLRHRRPYERPTVRRSY